MLSITEWWLLSLNKIKIPPQSVSPKSDNAMSHFWSQFNKGRGDRLYTWTCGKAVSHVVIVHVYVSLPHLKKDKCPRDCCSLGVLITDPSSHNVCGFCELQTILHWSFCSSFIFQLGLMKFFFSSVGRQAVLPAFLPLPELWKQIFGRNVEKLYRVPRESEWVSVGILSAMCQCAEVGVAFGPALLCFWRPTCSMLLLKSALATPLPLSCVTVVPTTRWIKCVLYS